MRSIARLATTTSVALLLAASALVVPQVASSQVAEAPPGENASPPAVAELSATPAEGPTGTRVQVSGSGCTLPDTTLPADAVVVTLGPPEGDAVFTTQLAVAPDGSWQGEVAAPAGTPAGELQVGATCIAPEQDLVTYEAVPHTVTGEGAAGATASLPPTSTLEAPDPSLGIGPPAPPSAGAAAAAGLPSWPYPSAPIEDMAAYDGQSTCSPSPKPGMVAFQNLLHDAFPSVGMGHISRSCSSGGQSEHKEGRALDWPVHVNNGAQAAYAQRVIDWLLATDSRGNRYSNARRLGIMYIIWNRRMWRMYRPEQGWQPYSGSSPHTDHIHFSLTRAGGAGSTSWWAPDLSSPPVETRSAGITVPGQYDEPVTGDFDGDGRDDILWYQPGTGADFIWWGRTDRSFNGTSVTINGTYRPATGDFDGDGKTDVLFHAPGPAHDFIWYGARTRSFRSLAYTVNGTYTPLTGDFGGDFRDDILWYAPGRSADSLWRGSATRVLRGVSVTINGVYQPLTGDWDGDGRDDVIWYGPGAGSDTSWFGGPLGFTGRAISISGTFPGAVAGGLNRDLRDDVLWYAPGPAPDAFWLGQWNRQFRGQATNVDGAYDPALVGDFDGNGTDDVLWYAPGTDAERLWWTS